jgi:hypothetical protein
MKYFPPSPAFANKPTKRLSAPMVCLLKSKKHLPKKGQVSSMPTGTMLCLACSTQKVEVMHPEAPTRDGIMWLDIEQDKSVY